MTGSEPPTKRPSLRILVTLISVAVISLAIWLQFQYPLSLLKLSIFFEIPDNPTVHNARLGVSYRGKLVDGIERFENIFYAEDTPGSRRFAPPVPYVPTPGNLIDATTPGAWCPQGTGDPPLPFTSPITNISENCLSLRVVRAAAPGTSQQLPVLVYIHGGGAALNLYVMKYNINNIIRWRRYWKRLRQAL